MYSSYLDGLEFSKTLFKADESNDHEHCNICWSKISEYPEDIHEAYSAKQGMVWICPECFEKNRDLYHWKLIQN